MAKILIIDDEAAIRDYIKKQEADAKTMLAQVKAAEASVKLQEAQGGLGGGQPTVLDQLKAQELQLKQQELVAKQQDAHIDAINRKRDRESRERLAAVKLAEAMAENPAGIPIVQNLLQPDMIQRLEANEQPLTEQ